MARRPDTELPFADEGFTRWQPILLDTCVYIDQMQDRAAEMIQTLVRHTIVNHSTAAIQELMHSVGVLDPGDRRTAATIGVIRSYVANIRSNRLFVPDADTSLRAALLAGIMCRIQGYGSANRQRVLQDCILFLQAQKLGFTLLTANVADFDILLQLIRLAA